MDPDKKKYVPPNLRSTRSRSPSTKEPSTQLRMERFAKVVLKISIMKATKQPLVKGDIWYLCDRAWFDTFIKYTSQGSSDSLNDSDSEKLEEAAGLSSCHPGQIDLSGLYANSKFDVRHPLSPREYIAIHESGWKRLVKEFGIKEGQKPIRREVVKRRAPRETELEVEVNLFVLQFYQNSNPDDVRKGLCSRNWTLGMKCDKFLK